MEIISYWLISGCFLTGYERRLLAECSANSRAAVARYTSALIIISIVWAFIGYSFCSRYIELGPVGSSIGAIIMVVVVIQIERQIILAFKLNWKLAFFRVFIAVLMAAIGSVIIDQIVFRQDIDNLKANNKNYNISLQKHFDDYKADNTQKKQRLIENNQYLESQNTDLEQQFKKERRTQPFSITTTKGADNIVTTQTKVNPNPALKLIKDEESANETTIKANTTAITVIDDSVTAQQLAMIKKVKPENKGFLNELDLLFTFIFVESNSKIPMIVYFSFLCFFLGVEVFVLLSKSGKDSNDYEHMVILQQESHKNRLNEHFRKDIEKIGIQKRTSEAMLSFQ